MKKINFNGTKYTKMTVLVKPNEFSQFLRFPRRTLLEEPRMIFGKDEKDIKGYILSIIEED
ncbi:hypothetical protein AAEX28_13905 [Lentisphaerota bacterium WC36G]|nr:hypothetical protein LJT99_00655 [Lentisphaerae bacterium WC36]